MNNFTVWAHRGGQTRVHEENSLEAIEHSLKNNCDGIEIDTWFHDEELILSHDKPSGAEHTKLSEALELIDSKKQIYLEIKHTKAAKPVYALSKKYLDNVIFASFDVEALRAIRKLDKSARLGLNYRGIDDHFIDITGELDIEYVTFNWLRILPNYFNIKQSRKATSAKHLAYTVNCRLIGSLLRLLKIDGIFTDHPVRF